jgi:uncharacterized SAM-binding protein YcdF (DUF218 family)
MRDLIAVIALALLAVALVAGYATFRVWSEGQRDDRQPADAIVVMGAAQYDGRPSPVFAARIDHAIDLFRAGVAPQLVVTGGKQEGDRTTEAATARAYAIARGCARVGDPRRGPQPDHARVHPRAPNPHGGARSAVRGLRLGPPHMLRVLRMAADDGITAYGSPTTTSPIEADPVKRADATVHELLALAQYFLVGGAPGTS